jgi:hypothetical protein
MLFALVPDRRRSERRWTALPVQIGMGKSLIEGTSLNLSEHGMYLFTAAHIPLGSNIEIVFCPPEEKSPVHVSAIVRRKVVYLYGIEFLTEPTQPEDDHRFLQSPNETGCEPLNRGLLKY